MKKYPVFLIPVLLTFFAIDGTAQTSDKTYDEYAVSDTGLPDTLDENYAWYYVVVADTGHNYDAMRKTMFHLKKETHIIVDTLGRYYNSERNLIVLADDDEDEMYAGEYYPRRYESDFLSLEYLNYFFEYPDPGTIAVIAGIFISAADAENALQRIRPFAPDSYNQRTPLYMGCMH